MADILKFPEGPRKGETPAQSTLRHVLTHPDVLNECARNLHESQSELFFWDAHREYDAFPEEEKQKWRDQVIEKLEAHANMTPQEYKKSQRWQDEENRKALEKTLEKNDRAFNYLMTQPKP